VPKHGTHYHELNELENKLSGVKNYHVTNKEVGNRIIFLRKLAPGGSTHSFGIHVARMAGMPPSLLQRANEVLNNWKHVDQSIGEQVKNLSAKVSYPSLMPTLKHLMRSGLYSATWISTGLHLWRH
jgi:DNA mismatch repair protein MutS